MTGNPPAWPAGEAPSIEAPIRAAEVVGALSLATDLGTGQPHEHALRTAVLAVRLGELAGAPGRSPIAGSYEGRDAVFGQFGRYGGETAGTFQAELKSVVGIHRNTGERNGKKLDVDCCIVFEVEDGQLVSGREHFFGLYAWDAFWA